MTADPGLFEVMSSMRAMRRLKPDPVPEALIWKIVEAGTQAPSGGNSQPWRFLVLQDPAHKAFIQERYKRAWDGYAAASLAAASRRPPLPPAEAEKRARLVRAATHLADHLHEAPVLLLVCMLPRPDLPPLDAGLGMLRGAQLYASIFPAVQNVLLACRALGLGATLTTLHLVFEPEIKARLAIPAEVESVALIPIGWPEGKFGATSRLPAQEVTFWDGWEQRRVRLP